MLTKEAINSHRYFYEHTPTGHQHFRWTANLELHPVHENDEVSALKEVVPQRISCQVGGYIVVFWICASIPCPRITPGPGDYCIYRVILII